MKFLEYILEGQLLKQSKPGGTSVKVDKSMNFESDNDNEQTSFLPILINANAQEQVREIQSTSVQNHPNTNSSFLPLLPSLQPFMPQILSLQSSISQMPLLSETPQPQRFMRIVKLYDQYGFDKEKNHAAIEKALDQHGQKKVF